MTNANSPDVLAEMALVAVERADLNERNFGLTDLCNELPSLGELGAERLKTVLVSTGCRCADQLIATTFEFVRLPRPSQLG